MANRRITVEIVGDTRAVERSFKRASTAATGFNRNLKRTLGSKTGALETVFGGRSFAAGLAGGVAALGGSEVFRQLSKSVGAAENLEQQFKRLKDIVGDVVAIDVGEWSKGLAENFGLAAEQGLQFAGWMAGTFKVVGLSGERSAKLSEQLVQLAADMAAFAHVPIEATFSALQKGVAGQMRGLKQFNILVDAAAVKQEALHATGKRSTAELTRGELVLARVALIMKDASVQSGAFAERSGDLAGQSKVLHANLRNLEENIGGILIPELTSAAQSANLLFEALERFRGVDFSPGFSFPKIPDALKTGLKAAPFSIAGGVVLGVRQALAKTLLSGPGPDRAGVRKGRFGFVPSDALAVATDKAAQEKAAAKAAAKARAAAAAVTASAAQALKASEKSRLAFETILDSLNLKLDKARVTATFRNDLAALEQMQAAIKRRIADEGKTTELLRQLFDVRQQVTAAQRSQRTKNQFEKLGLTATGEQRTPGAGALLHRTRNLQDQVKGTVLDTGRTRTQLQRIAALLKKDFNKVGKDVRAAILQMLNDISGALGDKKGPLTKTTSLNSKKLLAGIGLSPDQIRELRGRFSSFNSAGLAPAGSQGQATGGFAGGATPQIDLHATLVVDGQRMTAVVTKLQQKTRRRNPQQKRGPHRLPHGA